MSKKFAAVLDEFGCDGAQLGEPAFPGGEPSATVVPAAASLSSTFGGFDDLIAAAAQGPAVFGGPVALASTGPGVGAGAVVAPPLDPYEVIRLLEGEVVRQSRYIAELQQREAHRPPLVVSIGTSPENMITVNIPQHQY